MEQKLFIAGFIPDKKSEEESGARRIATAFYARDLKHARAKASFIFVEEYPAAQDAAYKHLLCEAVEGIPCPETGKWDEQFLYDHDWPEDIGHPVARADAPDPGIDFEKLTEPTRIAVLVKYGTSAISFTMLQDAMELLQDDSGTYEAHIVEAIIKTPSVAAMHPERIIEAIDFLKEKCSSSKKWPEIKAALSEWENKHIQERGERPQEETAAAPVRSDRGEIKHDYRTLAIEIALGILARSESFNIYKVPGAIINRAREIVQQRDKAFCAWQERLGLVSDILDYSRAQIIYAVKTAPEGIETDTGNLGGYINRVFTETDHASPDPHMVAVACGESADENKPDTNNTAAIPSAETEVSQERQGPFYFLFSDGVKVGRANKITGLEKALADGAKEISQDEYQARKNGSWKDEQPCAQDIQEETPQPAAPANTKCDSNEGEKEEIQPQPVISYQSVGEILEKELADKPSPVQDNLGIWRSVMRTDPRFTKPLTGTGFDGTSINSEYMIMKATELFGPIGSRWGFDIIEDRMIPGAPLSEAIYEDKKFVGNRILRDADGALLFEQNHSLKIRLWYKTENDEGSIYAYGATPYIQKTKNGIRCDGEAQKKSLTDAIKKGLSLLGFSADVWLGMYDLPEYVAELHTEFGLKNAIHNAEDSTRLYAELDDKMTRVANTIEKATSVNEAKKVFDTLAREVEIHRKSAEEKGDEQRTRYLSSRLRRLTKIRDDRIQSLTKEEQPV